MGLNKNRGFTLVEVMIVVAIIAVVAAIAIPNIMRMRCTANDKAALSAVRSIVTAMESYYMSQTPSSYLGAGLWALSSANPLYIDSSLGAGTKQGYRFLSIPLTQNSYFIWAFPQQFRTSGNFWYFYSNSNMWGLQGGSVYQWSWDNPGWRPVD